MLPPPIANNIELPLRLSCATRARRSCTAPLDTLGAERVHFGSESAVRLVRFHRHVRRVTAARMQHVVCVCVFSVSKGASLASAAAAIYLATVTSHQRACSMSISCLCEIVCASARRSAAGDPRRARPRLPATAERPPSLVALLNVELGRPVGHHSCTFRDENTLARSCTRAAAFALRPLRGVHTTTVPN
ncbi:hypothetical protein DAEQUDRAFT_90200 [Daedalea quercina L-15889]|uniref:Uncharacterized protein n=1 Tax=Daedalea quercina L-15889 TaxID=1314783 RepID=A0A165S7P1_9APHY|nr:hypothetical protein DAEQUDRAFT_90200 [Daedalea quercina L-15889]